MWIQIESEEDITMKRLRRELRKAICVFITVAMLCSDAGLSVYATAAAGQDHLTEIMEETPSGETQADEDHAEQPPIEDSQAEEPSVEESQPDGSLTEDEKTEADSSEEIPGKEETGEDIPDTGAEETEESVSENEIEGAGENSIKTVMETGDHVIASGEYKENGNDITWVIDENGKLTVEGTGDFSDSYEAYRAPWSDHRMSIKSAEINVKDMTNARYMFLGCENLIELDLSHFDTSSVTDMGSMFSGCKGLQSIDLSRFDTSWVTDMNGLFFECEGLKSIDLSNWDTSCVVEMGCMFSRCKGLQNIDISHFDTSKRR